MLYKRKGDTFYADWREHTQIPKKEKYDPGGNGEPAGRDASSSQ